MVSELLCALADAHDDDDVRVHRPHREERRFAQAALRSDERRQPGVSPEPSPKGDYADLLLAMVRTEKPIVARVNGPAMGGGLGLVAASTFAIADVNAKLGTLEIDVGLFPMIPRLCSRVSSCVVRSWT